MTLLAAVCGFLVAPPGCIVRPPLEAPSQDGERWIELRSQHFTLATDLEPEEATRAIRTFEHVYAVLARVIFGESRPPDFETQVVAFRSESEFRAFVPSPFGGRYVRRLPNDIDTSPTMLIFGRLTPSNRIMFIHELAHRFNHVALGSIPLWLNEGLAQFYSTVRGNVEKPIVGALDPEAGFASGSVWSDPNHVIFHGRRIPSAQLPRPSRLMRFDRDAFYGSGHRIDQESSWEQQEAASRNYAAAWALVHMLMSGDSKQALRMQRFLRERASADSEDGPQTFSDLDPDDLDREFDAYVKKALPWRQHHEPAPPVVGQVQQRELKESRVLLWWARLHSFEGASTARAEQLLDRALALSRDDDPEVQFWMGRLKMIKRQPKAAEGYFKSALSSEPDNARYQTALALLYLNDKDGPGAGWPATERRVLLRGAMDQLAKVARTAVELNLVATDMIFEGKAEDALPFAQKACAADSDCWECFHTHAAAAFQTGDASAAEILERSALQRLPEEAPAKTAEILKQALQSYKTAGDGSSPASPAKIPLFVPK